MPFDPKLIRPDDAPVDEGGELRLPSDLSALAQQLCDDAEHLSRVYPPATTKPTARRWATRWSFAAPIGTALATALVIALTLWYASTSDSMLQASPGSSQAGLVSSAPPATTPVSLTELSAPELEAVLDVLEQDNTRPISVSF
jgi:hypothetical protein